MKITKEMYERLQVSAQVKEQQRKWQEEQKKTNSPDTEDNRREAMWELSHSL